MVLQPVIAVVLIMRWLMLAHAEWWWDEEILHFSAFFYTKVLKWTKPESTKDPIITHITIWALNYMSTWIYDEFSIFSSKYVKRASQLAQIESIIMIDCRFQINFIFRFCHMIQRMSKLFIVEVKRTKRLET